MAATKEEVFSLIQATKLKRQPYEDEMREISKYFLPRRSNWEKEKKSQKDENIPDSTGIRAVALARNGIQGYMCNDTVPWFALQAPEDIEQQNKDWFTAILQTWQDHLYKTFPRTNFYSQLGAVIADGWGPATGIMAMKEDLKLKRIVFHAVHPKQIFIDEDENKEVAVVMREFTMPVNSIVSAWPGKAPAEFEEKAKKDPYEQQKMVHLVRRQKDKATGFEWVSIYALESGQVILSEKAVSENVYTVWRYDTNSDDLYGRGPAHDTLSEMKILCQIAKTKLKAAQKAVDPPIWYSGEIQGILDMNPGGANAFSGQGMQGPQAISNVSGFPYAIEEQQQYQKAIRDAFMSDFFQMLQEAPQGMTATEVMERQGEKAAVLAAVTGRMVHELITPIIDKTLRMEYEAGRLPMPQDPTVPKNVNIEAILNAKQIQYTGMLPMLQKKHSLNQTTQQIIQMMGGMAQVMGPTIMDWIDTDKWVPEILKVNGLPAGAIRTERDIKKMRDARAQEQAKQQQMAMQMETMKNAGQLSKTVEPGSVMSQLGQAVQDTQAGGRAG